MLFMTMQGKIISKSWNFFPKQDGHENIHHSVHHFKGQFAQFVQKVTFDPL